MESNEMTQLNTFSTNINELYKKSQSVPRSKHTPSLLYKPVS